MRLENLFLEGSTEVNSGEWQSQKNTDPNMVSWEVEDLSFQWPIPSTQGVLVKAVQPNMPWAEEHFQERVSGHALNPPPSHERWPHRRKDNAEHMPSGRFSHTYPERFWPKRAGSPDADCYTLPDGDCASSHCRLHGSGVFGVRFNYGDLGDVVKQLSRSPLTRQAYLPVWFPEDTGAVHGERVPCTLGYLFKMRRGQLNCTYYIRSCDFMRHFADDVYMACRLVQWMCHQLDPNRGGDVSWPRPGALTMHVGSFHVFAGDKPILEHRRSQRLKGAF